MNIWSDFSFLSFWSNTFDISRLISVDGESILLIKTIEVDLINYEKLVFLSILRPWDILPSIRRCVAASEVFPLAFCSLPSLSVLFVLFLWRSQLFLIDKHKKNFSSLLLLVGILETEYLVCVCVHASLVNYFTRIHILIERRRKRGNDLCWSTHHWKTM